MDKTFLQEAFHSMQLLEEETFQLDDVGIKDMIDFGLNDELDDRIDVIDVDAENEDELKDSYIGNVILECQVCHSPIFKAVEDVEIDEDSDLANIEEECPICHSNDGFKVIGQVAPFQEDPEIKVEVEDKPVDDEVVEEDTEDEDTAGEDVAEEDTEDEDDLKESLNEGRTRPLYDEVYNELSATSTGVHNQWKIPAQSGERYSDGDGMADKGDDKNKLELSAYNGEVPDGVGAIKVSVPDKARLDFAKKVADNFKEQGVTYKDLFGGKPHFGNFEALVLVPMDEALTESSIKDKLARFAKKHANEELEEDTKFGNFADGMVSKEQQAQALDQEAKERERLKDAEGIPMPKKADESLHEGFEKVDLEMEDKIIHVSEEQKEPIPDAEMITPVSDELEAELMNPAEEEVPVEDEAPVEEVPEEMPMEDDEEPIEDEAPVEDDEEPIEDEEEFNGQESLKEGKECNCSDKEVEYDIDNFDEKEFNKLGESYLKNVYENVDSFKTTDVAANSKQLVIEGVIKFNSGKSKKTRFVFEAKEATNKGQVRFIGENTQITRGKKAFTLTGQMNKNQFIAESLNYNYRANSNRVYGTVKNTKK